MQAIHFVNTFFGAFSSSPNYTILVDFLNIHAPKSVFTTCGFKEIMALWTVPLEEDLIKSSVVTKSRFVLYCCLGY